MNMNETIPKGTIKTLVDTFFIKDMNVSNIIKNELRDKGFDLIVKPRVDTGTNFFIGEEIEVFSETKLITDLKRFFCYV